MLKRARTIDFEFTIDERERERRGKRTERGTIVVRADLLSALVNLGYPRPSVEKAVGDVLKVQPGAAFDEALRQALGRLARA